MTREEARKTIRKMLAVTDLSVRGNLKEDMVKACNIAIEALEQEPCDDAIGRSDMLDAIGHGTTYTSEELQKIIKALPPVTPQKTGHWILADVNPQEPCNDAISRQAVIDEMCKRYSVGDMITLGFIQKLPSVNPQTDVLDAIRAEVADAQLIGYATVNGKREIASKAVMEIIDKYRKVDKE